MTTELKTKIVWCNILIGWNSDNFTGPNGTALTTHDAHWAGDTTYAQIYDGYCQFSETYLGGNLRYEAGQSADPQKSQCVFKATSSAQFTRYVCVRMPTGNAGYSFFFDQSSGSNYSRCYLNKNGVPFGVIATGSWAYASDHTMGIEVSGTSTTQIKCYIDGGQVGSTQEDSSSPITTGYPGFSMVGQINQGVIDDWQDGW